MDWFFFSHRLPIAVGALSQGYEVHIATTFTDLKYKEELLNKGFYVHDLSIDRSGKNPLSILVNFFIILGLCVELKPDLAHFVTLQPVLIGGLAAKVSGVKRVVFAISGLGHVFVANSFFTKLRCFLIQFLYRFALSVQNKAVIFQNTQDMDKICNICSISREECFLISGSGVDLNHFAYAPLHDTPIVVLMASRLLATKGVREFVEAAKILKHRGFSPIFKLVGAPDNLNPAAITLDELNSWSQLGIVETLGHRNDLNQLMVESHIVCLPSYYPEGLPKVLCEAAACGRVVITTDEPGCRDAIENGITGILISSRSSSSLADAIEYLLSTPDMIRNMGIAGRKRAERLFDVNIIVANHLDIYSYLLKSP